MNDTTLIAKLSCPCKTLQTSSSFTKSDTGIVIDRGPHRVARAKKPLVSSIGCRVHAGCSVYIKYKIVLFPKLFFFYILDIYN